MPTGYTAGIEDGIGFEDFVMGCARGFGALILMRDDPTGTSIPEFKPSTHNIKALEKARKEKTRLEKLSAYEIQQFADDDYDDKRRSNEASIQKNHELRDKYESMLSKVRLWEPPSEGHVELKRFMVNQIQESIDFDCNTSYYEKEVVRLTPEQWLKEKHENVDWNINYHETENQKEIERVADRNLWVNQLKDSLK